MPRSLVHGFVHGFVHGLVHDFFSKFEVDRKNGDGLEGYWEEVSGESVEEGSQCYLRPQASCPTHDSIYISQTH